MSNDRYLIKLHSISHSIFYRNFNKNYDFFGKKENELFSYLITEFSPISLRKAVYKLAVYFRREFSYDFVQYSEDPDPLEECQAYVWTSDDGFKDTIIGACCFRLREYKDYKPGWALQWIWFHPFERNKGHLSKRWKYFEEKYGKDFYVEPPLSNAMKAFLQKRNYDLHTKGYEKT